MTPSDCDWPSEASMTDEFSACSYGEKAEIKSSKCAHTHGDSDSASPRKTDKNCGASLQMAERMAEALKNARKSTVNLNKSAGSTKPILSSTSTNPSTAMSYLSKHNIMKRVLHLPNVDKMPPECLADGGGIEYPCQTKFIFDYRIRDPDQPEVIIDDTKKYGKRMELYSGKDFQLDFWEHCLSTMLIGEVASFMVPPRCLVAFPSVNKKLRDYMLNKVGPGSAGGAPKHCCGFMSLREQGGLGYPDLDELMVKPKVLEFIFELISVTLPCQERKDTWIMTAEEKASTVPVLREEGNQLYAECQWIEAAAKYEEALGLLEQLLLREKPGDPEYQRIDADRVPFYLNLALCQFKLKDYYGAINNATEALSREPTNIKALFRRAMSYSENADLELAEKDFRCLRELAPDMENVITKELAKISSKHRAWKDEERRRLAGKLFGSACS